MDYLNQLPNPSVRLNKLKEDSWIDGYWFVNCL